MQNFSYLFYEEIVKAKTQESSIIERHPKFDTAFSSNSLHSSRILDCESTDYAKILDYDILSPQAEKILRFPFKSQEDWLDVFMKTSLQIEAFFKDCQFSAIVNAAFESEDPRIIKQIILTLDYKTNLLTFILFLLWKWKANENEQDMGKFVTNETVITQFFAYIIEFRLNEFNNDCQLILLIQQTIQILPKQSFEKAQKSIIFQGISQNSKPYPTLNPNQVLPWSPEEVATMLSFINQSFYVELKIHDIIAKGGLKYYFKRINTLSQYIIYSVIKNKDKHQRQYALAYWIDIAEKLQSHNDLEGLFIVYKYGIQLLLKDYINNTPILFRDLNRIPKIHTFYEQEIKHNCENCVNKNYNIPSFNKYSTLLRRLEQQAKQNSAAFEQISLILETLMKISKEQYHTQQNMKQQLNFREVQILRFVTEGIGQKLESELKIPLEKETLVYIELIKLSKL